MWRLTIGNKQHRARWPIAAQISVKSSVLVGAVGAILVSVHDLSETPYMDHEGQLTWCAVEVSNAEDISGTAHGGA